jgi:carboxyl-terminal processing protease
VDWQAAHDEILPLVQKDMTEDEFAQTMRDLLARLPAGLARYETRAERIEAETADTVNYEGIGAFISVRAEPEPHVVLLAVIAGSPAENAGLLAHDSIYAIDGAPVTEEEGLNVVNRVRGPAASEVTLTVQTPGAARRDVTLQRAQLAAVDSVRGGLLLGTSIAYLRLPTLGDSSLADSVGGALQSLSDGVPGGLTGVLLDLRIAHTGSGWPLVEMLSMFGAGDMGEFFDRATTTPVAAAPVDVAGSQTVPLVLLIGPDTEGLPEIFAAALQSAGRATLVGFPTPGYIEIPAIVPLPDGSRAFIAASAYRTSKGEALGLTGLTPDARVEADWDEVTDAEDEVVERAMEAAGK